MSLIDQIEALAAWKPVNRPPVPVALKEIVRLSGYPYGEVAHVSLSRDRTICYVNVEFGSRGSLLSDDLEIPVWVIESPNIQVAVKKWNLEADLQNTLYNIKSTETALESLRASAEKLQAQLKELED